MKNEKLKPGQIAKGYRNGTSSRHGAVVEVSNKKTTNVLNGNESQKDIKSDPLPPGWIEFYI